MVMTSVTINNETLEMWLPVMDGANQAMKKESYEYSTRYGVKSVDAAYYVRHQQDTHAMLD
jgi:hypothetical protein